MTIKQAATMLKITPEQVLILLASNRLTIDLQSVNFWVVKLAREHHQHASFEEIFDLD